MVTQSYRIFYEVVNTFMRRNATHKAKLVFIRRKRVSFMRTKSSQMNLNPSMRQKRYASTQWFSSNNFRGRLPNKIQKITPQAINPYHVGTEIDQPLLPV